MLIAGGAGERAQLVKFLPDKDLSLISRTHVNSRTKMKTQVWLCMPVTPALGRQKQEDPWCSLAS